MKNMSYCDPVPGQSAERKAEEDKLLTKVRRRVTKRQKIGDGWDGSTEEGKINWPLAVALLREGNKDLLKAAMYYRKIEASANSSPVLGGTGVDVREVTLDRETRVRSDGAIVQKAVRQSQDSLRLVDSGKRVGKADDKANPEDIKAPAGGAYKGDSAVNAAIDARHEYKRLYALMGPIVDAFENMVCGEMTYLEAGKRMGVGNESGARGAAQAVVHMGLVAVRDGTEISYEDLLY